MVKYLKCSFAQDIKTMEEIAIGPVTDEEHSIWKYTYSDGFIQNRRLVKEVFVRNHKENNSWWQFDLEEERKSRTKLISWWVCHLQGSQDAFSKSPFSIWRADLQGKYLLYAQDEKIHVLKFQFCCSIFINPRDFKKKTQKTDQHFALSRNPGSFISHIPFVLSMLYLENNSTWVSWDGRGHLVLSLKCNWQSCLTPKPRSKIYKATKQLQVASFMIPDSNILKNTLYRNS